MTHRQTKLDRPVSHAELLCLGKEQSLCLCSLQRSLGSDEKCQQGFVIVFQLKGNVELLHDLCDGLRPFHDFFQPFIKVLA